MNIAVEDGIPLPIGSKCFICSGDIEKLRVEWIGLKGHVVIYLHPECADYMASGLKRDYLEIFVGKQAADEWYAKYKRPHRRALWSEQ